MWHTLSPGEPISLLPSAPGVYVFLEDGLPIYIGESRTLVLRVKGHRQGQQQRAVRFKRCVVKWRCERGLGEALMAEFRLIKKLRPLLNRQTDQHGGGQS